MAPIKPNGIRSIPRPAQPSPEQSGTAAATPSAIATPHPIQSSSFETGARRARLSNARTQSIHASPVLRTSSILWNASLFKTLSSAQRFLIGMAIGDAYGMAFEFFGTRREIAELWQKVGFRYRAHSGPEGLHRPGQFSDDTQMTLAVMEALLESQRERKPLTRETLAKHFIAAFQRDPIGGYSGRVRRALETSQSPEDLLAQLTYVSTSNGAAMRAIPFGMISDIPTLIDYATLNAEVTHHSLNAQASSVAIALMAHYHYFNIRDMTLLDFVVRHLKNKPEFQAMADHLETVQSLGRNYPQKIGTDFFELGGRSIDGIGLDGVQTAGAVFHLLTHYDQRPAELLRQAILLGGDTDSVAALSLGIAAIRSADFGGFPDELVEGLSEGPWRRDYLLQLGEQFGERFPRYHGAVFLVTNRARTKFLLQEKNPNYPHFPQGLCFFGGKVEFGEEAEEAALRERDEELSPEAVAILQARKPHPVFHGEVKSQVPGAEAHWLTLFEYVVSDAELDALATFPVFEGKRSVIVHRDDLAKANFVWGLDQPMKEYLRARPDRSLDPDYDDFQKMLNGDNLAFFRLYQKHQGLIRSLCRRFLYDASRVEDTVQSVFVRARRAFQGFEFRCSFKSWLSTIAVNLSLNENRKTRRTVRLLQTHLPPQSPFQVDLIEREEALAPLFEAIALLTPLERAIVECKLQDLSEKEIADQLHITQNSIGSKFRRIVQRLKRRLHPESKD